MSQRKSKHRGSSFDSYLKKRLKDAGFRKKFEQARLELMIGQMVRGIMKESKLSVRKLAEKMEVSPAQVQRLLDDKNVTLNTLAKFVAATDRNVMIEIQ